jgi:hypothetical protein
MSTMRRNICLKALAVLSTAALGLLLSAVADAQPGIKLPRLPADTKEFPHAETSYVPFYVTSDMIAKKKDLQFSLDLAEKQQQKFTVGFLSAKGEVRAMKDQEMIDEPTLHSLVNLAGLPQPGWHFAAIRGPKRQIRGIRVTTSGDQEIVQSFTVTPNEKGTQFTISYKLNVPASVSCDAYPSAAPNNTFQIQGPSMRTDKQPYDLLWDASGQNSGPYTICLSAKAVNDPTLNDQRNANRTVSQQ